jgi:hypothetical protein
MGGSERRMLRSYHIAWWNLENRRTDEVFRPIKNDTAGWTPQLRDRKIEQLASVIAAMNTGQGRVCSACVRSRIDSSSTDSLRK